MSRSYREPWFVCGYGSKYKKYIKRYANSIVRNTIDVPDGRAYRKLFDSWNISDYRFAWNPYPRYYWRNGEMKSYEPIPEWKARRK